MAVDRSSPVPLWSQVEGELRMRLATGEFDDGFPTEADLMETYAVSRGTVRQAIAALERDGMVTRRRGDGTRVTDLRLTSPLSGIYNLASWITSTGRLEHSVVPVAEMRPLPDEAADRLGLVPLVAAVHIVRVRYAGDEPLAVSRSWIPEPVGASLLGQDLTSGSLYDHLARWCNVRPTGSEDRIRPVDPTRDDRLLLDLPSDQMGFQVERVVYADLTPIEYRVSIIRGDRYEFTAAWGTPAAPPTES